MTLKKVIRLNLIDKRITQPERGWLLQLMPLLTEVMGAVNDIHIVTLEPGVIRGNHYHELMTEALLPLSDGLRIVWQDADGRHEEITKAGESLYIFAPTIPHAMRNDSPVTALGVAFGNTAFNPDSQDRHPHPLF